MQHVLAEQKQQKANFDQRIEQHDKLLIKYRKELYNESLPELERLFQLERIITQFIDLLNSDKYNEGYHQYDFEGTFTGFMEWKTRLSERIISEYTSLLNAVSVRARQISFRLTNNMPSLKSSDLTKEEKDLSKPVRGPYKTKRIDWLKWYNTKAGDIIYSDLKSRRSLNYEHIEKKILDELRNRDIPDSTIRTWFPANKKEQRLDEIRQQVSKSFNFN